MADPLALIKNLTWVIFIIFMAIFLIDTISDATGLTFTIDIVLNALSVLFWVIVGCVYLIIARELTFPKS